MGLGTWPLGGDMAAGDLKLGYSGIDESETIRALERGLEAGVTLVDTADAYGAGHAEHALRPVLAAHPEVLIATKFGNVIDERTRQLTGVDVSPEHVRSAAEASLARLGRDRIDLFQLHTPDITAAQADDVLAALEELVDAGSIAWYGVSTDDPALAQPFVAGDHCTAMQIELNVLDDNSAMLELCEKADLGVLCRSPLAMGLLGGKYSADRPVAGADDVRTHQPEWLKWFVKGTPSPEYLVALDAVRDALTSDGRSLVQGALAWIWARSDRAVPIPGFRNAGQVNDLVGAAEFGPLSPEAFDRIEQTLRGADAA
ncbi:aldo/keto reductase [Planctomonas sp. JC2975]|nr:aldo/keto reductase [Planctomonas sp. JC2975]NNC11439.1 aldo/keto reductase [Planctomonas sp. JC2975]